MFFVKSGGHLHDHVTHRTASSAESLSLSSSAFLAALFFGFFLVVDVDFLAYVAGPAATACAAARARAAAKQLAQAKEGCGVLSTAQLLRQSSVAPTTLRAYEIGVREFETYARNHKWKMKSGSTVDAGRRCPSLACCTASSQKSFPKGRSNSLWFLPTGAQQSP